MTAPARPRASQQHRPALTARERERVTAETAVARRQERQAAKHEHTARTAAATPVLADARGQFKLKPRADWQADAFAYRKTCPELGYANRYVSNTLSMLRLIPSCQITPDDDPVRYDAEDSKLTPVEQAQLEVEFGRLNTARGGQPQILRRLAGNVDLVGECYIVAEPARADGTPETWEVYSVAELSVQAGSGKLVEVAAGPAGADRVLTDGTFVLRVHQEDLEHRQDADSPVRNVLDACEELAILNRMIRATGMSRIATSSMIGFPTEGLGNRGLDPDDDDETSPGTPQLLTDFMQHWVDPIADEGHPAAAAPFAFHMAGEELAKIREITLSRPLDETMAKQRTELRQTIAVGLDLPPEVLTGLSDLNHWTAATVDANTYKSHLQPRAVMLCEALTVGWLRPALMVPTAEGGPGWSADRAALAVIWPDASRLIRTPDAGDASKEAWEEGLIKGTIRVQALGFNPDEDMPDDEELAQRVALGTLGRRVTGQDSTDPGGTTVPVTTSAPAVTAAARPSRGARLSRRLLDIDRDLRARVETECDRALDAALTRAGNRVVNSAQRASADVRQIVNGAPSRAEVTRHAGQAVVAALGLTDEELLADSLDPLLDRFTTLTAEAQQQILDELEAALGLTAVEVERFAGAQQTARARAGEVLLAGMLALATARLFAGVPGAPHLGEVTSGAVPVGLVRQALTVAGGGSAGASGQVSTASVELRGGVGIGGDVYDLLTGRGARQDGWEWVYGVSSRRFEPHVALTGVRFAEFDDPALVNRDSFPEEPFYSPGDHPGCHCDAYPVWALAEAGDQERFFPHSGSDGLSAPGQQAA